MSVCTETRWWSWLVERVDGSNEIGYWIVQTTSLTTKPRPLPARTPPPRSLRCVEEAVQDLTTGSAALCWLSRLSKGPAVIDFSLSIASKLIVVARTADQRLYNSWSWTILGATGARLPSDHPQSQTDCLTSYSGGKSWTILQLAGNHKTVLFWQI